MSKLLIVAETPHAGRMALLAGRIRQAMRDGKAVALLTGGEFVRVIAVSEVKPKVKP